MAAPKYDTPAADILLQPAMNSVIDPVGRKTIEPAVENYYMLPVAKLPEASAVKNHLPAQILWGNSSSWQRSQ